MDTDSDGTADTIAVDIVRPRETDATGVKVPVIMDASPYYECCGRGNESEKKTYDSDGVIAKMPLFYDNYFVPRGYGVVGVDIVGTGRSTGCGDVGGKDEIASVVAVIDWLNGRNTATLIGRQPGGRGLDHRRGRHDRQVLRRHARERRRRHRRRRAEDDRADLGDLLLVRLHPLRRRAVLAGLHALARRLRRPRHAGLRRGPRRAGRERRRRVRRLHRPSGPSATT